MNTAKTQTENLIIRILGKDNSNSVIPIKSETFVLAESSAGQTERTDCSVKRDEVGAFVQSFSGPVTINGTAPNAGQRLMDGDQISVGRNVYEIQQVGAWNGEASNVAANASNANDQVNQRIEKIEAELNRQVESFDSIQSRFDEMGQRMEMLLSAIAGESQTTPKTGTDGNSLPAQETLQIEEQLQTQQQFETPEGPDGFTTASQPSEDLLVQSGQDEAEGFLTPGNKVPGQEHLQNAFAAVAGAQQLEQVDAATEAGSSDGDLSNFAVNESHEESGLPPVLETLPALHNDNEPSNEVDEVGVADTEPVEESESMDTSGAEESAEQKKDARNEELENASLLARLSALTGESPVLNENENSESAVDQSFEQNLESTDDQLPEEPSRGDQESLQHLLSSLNSSDVQEDAEFQSGENSPEEADSANEPLRQGVDTNELESLFATLRENEQRSVSEIDGESIVESAIVDNNHLNDLDKKLNEWRSEPNQIQLPAQEPVEQSEFPVQPEIKNDASHADNLPTVDNFGQTHVESSGDESLESSPALASFETPMNDSFGVSSAVDLVDTDGQANELPSADQLYEQAQHSFESESVATVEAVSVPETGDLSPAHQEETKQESVAELLARMQAMPDLDEQPGVDTEPQGGANASDAGMLDAGNGTESNVEPVQPAEANENTGGGEGDVQDYMNSLLQRLNGGQPSADSDAPTASDQKNASDFATQDAGPVIPEDISEPEVPLNPEEFKPKRVAPETNSNLAAMRELANATSRNAVQRSQLQKKKQEAHAMLLAAGGAVIGAFICSFLSKESGDLFYILSMVLFLATMVCSALYAKSNLLGGGKKTDKKEPAKEASLSETSDGLMGKFFKKKETENSSAGN